MYRDDFSAERRDREAAAGEKERLRMDNEKLERETKKLKKRIKDLKDQLDANNGQHAVGLPPAVGAASPNCQKCPGLQKEVHSHQVFTPL